MSESVLQGDLQSHLIGEIQGGPAPSRPTFCSQLLIYMAQCYLLDMPILPNSPAQVELDRRPQNSTIVSAKIVLRGAGPPCMNPISMLHYDIISVNVAIRPLQ